MFAPRIVAPPIVKSVLVVVILFDSVAAPVVLKPLGAITAPVAPLVNSPELVITTVVAEVIALFIAKAVPVRDIVPTSVTTAPVNVVVPDPADCVIESAVKAELAVTFAALTMVTAPRDVPPAIPVKTILPVPAVSPKEEPPSTVVPKVILAPPPDEVFIVRAPEAILTAPVILTTPLTVVKEDAAVVVTAPIVIVADAVDTATVPATLTAFVPVFNEPPENVVLDAAALPRVNPEVLPKLVVPEITLVAAVPELLKATT